MKNFVILGLAAMMLFTLSAGMSIWLNQSRTPDTQPTEPGARKNASREFERKADTEPRSLPRNGLDKAEDLSSGTRDRENRFDKRQAQMEMMLQDLRAERESVDALRRQVMSEMKLAAARASESEVRPAVAEKSSVPGQKNPADAKSRPVEIDAAERKNIERMASMYDSMPVDSAAKILQQMADSGRMDTAVKVLSQMKERQAAKLLDGIANIDTALAAQLLEKLRSMKRDAPSAAAAPNPMP